MEKVGKVENTNYCEKCGAPKNPSPAHHTRNEMSLLTIFQNSIEKKNKYEHSKEN